MNTFSKRYLGGVSAALLMGIGMGIGTPGAFGMQDDPIDRVADEREVLRERAKVEFDNAYQRAEELLGQEDFSGAQNVIVTAKVKINRSRTYLTEAEFNDRNSQAEQMIDAITTARITKEQEEEAIRKEVARQQKEIDQAREAQRRQTQIDERLLRVRQLQAELKYDAALQVVDEILFLDEHNAAALVLRDVMIATKLYRDYADVQRARELSYGKLSLDVQENMIAPETPMSYPDDWPVLSLRRTGAAGFIESPADQRVAQIMGDTRIPVDFSENTVAQVLSFMEQVSGLNIYADWNALDFAGINPEDKISLHLGEVSVETALERVLEQLGDDYDSPPKFAVQDGMVVVSSEEALRKHTVTVVYDIRDLLFEVPYFDNAPDFDIGSASRQGMPGANANAAAGSFGGDAANAGNMIFGDPDDDSDRPSRGELVNQIVNIIEETVDNWRDLGDGTGIIQELNGNLIITQTPDHHRQIEGLLSQLREIRAIQVNVEARFLSVATNWFEQIGIDLDIYFDTNSKVRSQQLAADPLSHLSDMFSPVNGQLIDPFYYGQVFDDGGNVVANRIPWGNTIGLPDPAGDTDGDGFGDLLYTVGPVGAPIRTTDGFTPLGFVQNSWAPDGSGLVDTLAEFDTASFAGLAQSVSPALALGVQFLDDIQVDLMIEATQADKRSVLLSAPRLTLFNGQRAWVAIATRVTYISNLVPVTGDNSGAFQPITDVVSDGFVLDVEAVVSADRRYVTMNVIAEQSEILAIEQKGPFGGAAGGGGDNGSAGQFLGFIEAPETQVALVYTTVSVPDKGTALLGGQRRAQEIEVESGVPILSKIPIINRFFTNRVTAKDEETLLILIRPEIIIQQENEDLLFPGLSDRLGNASSYLQ